MNGVNAAIEVGKRTLEIALGSDGALFSEPNQSRATTRLAKRLVELGCERVLIEGGSYQNGLVAALRAAELPAVIINPRRVREFAKSIGQLAKTDSDRCAGTGMEEHRLEHAPKALHRSLRAHIDYLRKQIKQADNDFDREVRKSALWDKYELLSSVPGVRPALRVTLLSDLPELGRLNRREIAALAGWCRLIATAARSRAAQDPGRPSTAAPGPVHGHGCCGAV
jgi:transposase